MEKARYPWAIAPVEEFNANETLSDSGGRIVSGDDATGLFAQSKEDSGMPKVGDMAPDFTLKHFDGNDLKDVKLSDYRGKKNVVLAFYIFAFTGG